MDYTAPVLQLQELFKATKSVEKYFRKEFPGNDSYAIPTHGESGQDSGRRKRWTFTDQ